METLLLNLAKLLVGFLCILGPIVFLMARLRVRDRREASLALTVLRELNSPDLRGLFSINVASRSIGSDSVAIDLWGCSREQVWDVVEKLSAKLPSHVQVEVNGVSGGRLKSAWTLTVNRRLNAPALCP
jgi:hypothetical protein